MSKVVEVALNTKTVESTALRMVERRVILTTWWIEVDNHEEIIKVIATVIEIIIIYYISEIV